MKGEQIVALVVGTVIIGGATYLVVTKLRDLNEEEKKDVDCSGTSGTAPTQPSNYGLRWDGAKDPGGPYWSRAARCVRLLESNNNYKAIGSGKSGPYFGAYQFAAFRTEGGYVPLHLFLGKYYDKTGDSQAFGYKSITQEQAKDATFQAYFKSIADTEDGRAAQDEIADQYYFGPAREYLKSKEWSSPGQIMAVYNAFVFAGPDDAKRRIDELGLEYAILRWRNNEVSNAGSASYGYFRWELVLLSMLRMCPWEKKPRIRWWNQSKGVGWSRWEEV